MEGPASPLWSIDASQIQELEIVGRRWWRGRGGRGSPSGTLVAASAKEAWWAAARWLRRALALGPRLRRRRPGAGGEG